MEPEHFKVKPEPGEQEVYEEAILFGYQQMDRLIGELLDLAGDDAALVLVTALSQQPSLKYEEIGGKNLYRPNNFQMLLDEAGIDRPGRGDARDGRGVQRRLRDRGGRDRRARRSSRRCGRRRAGDGGEARRATVCAASA